MPFYIRDPSKRPQITDGSILSAGGWTCGNTASAKLLQCLEAVRDLRVQADRLLSLPEDQRTKREVKPLSVPLFTLLDLTLGLLNFLTCDPVVRREVTPEQHEHIGKKLRAMEKRGLKKQGDLGLVRSKLGAHIDPVALRGQQLWDNVDAAQFAKWGIELLAVISQVLSFKRLYAWTELGTPDGVWHLMAINGTIVHFARENGEWGRIAAISDAMSPRVVVSDEPLIARQSMRHLLGDFRQEEWVIKTDGD